MVARATPARQQRRARQQRGGPPSRATPGAGTNPRGRQPPKAPRQQQAGKGTKGTKGAQTEDGTGLGKNSKLRVFIYAGWVVSLIGLIAGIVTCWTVKSEEYDTPRKIIVVFSLGAFFVFTTACAFGMFYGWETFLEYMTCCCMEAFLPEDRKDKGLTAAKKRRKRNQQACILLGWYFSIIICFAGIITLFLYTNPDFAPEDEKDDWGQNMNTQQRVLLIALTSLPLVCMVFGSIAYCAGYDECLGFLTCCCLENWCCRNEYDWDALTESEKKDWRQRRLIMVIAWCVSLASSFFSILSLWFQTSYSQENKALMLVLCNTPMAVTLIGTIIASACACCCTPNDDSPV